MSFNNCPSCGKWCSNVYAKVVGFGGEETIDKVMGTCKKHGLVDLTKGDWAWEDFFGEGEATDGE